MIFFGLTQHFFQFCHSESSSSIPPCPLISSSPTTYMSSLSTSMNLLFGRPLCLLPGSSIFIILQTIYSPSLFCTCPYHPTLTLSLRRLICAVPPMLSSLILSILVTLRENLNIFNPSSSATCLLVSATKPKQHSWSHYFLLNLFFHLFSYSLVTAHS